MMQELNYIRCGDYYIPNIRLPEENRPIGRWGRMHRDYIKEQMLIIFLLSIRKRSIHTESTSITQNIIYKLPNG